MSSLVFDIETDGLLDTCTKIHSLVIYCLETRSWVSCCDQPGYVSIKEGLDLLADAKLLIGHNIIKFDIQAIEKLYPKWSTHALIRDTLVCSRLIWTDRKEADFSAIKSGKFIPGKFIGKHSLESWGYRLRDKKGEFCHETDWKYWSKEMQDYCEQDVQVTLDLWLKIQAEHYSEEAIQLEHDFQFIILKQEEVGFPFDVDLAVQLYSQLSAKREQLHLELQELFPPKQVKTVFIPKRSNKTKGWIAGVEVTRVTEIPFNPTSRQQIAERLVKQYNWKPEQFTDKGLPKIDDTTLEKIPYPEVQKLMEYLLISKRIGQIAEGSNAWLKLEKDGCIHGEVITNGAVTGRCTHIKPNMAQVPSVDHPYGEECRSLFGAPEGWLQIGCDASGLELRCLAHYMGRYDGGQYAEAILHGDIHTENQKAAGLPTRGQAKTFIYAFNYGAGDIKLGSIVKPDAVQEQQRLLGKQLRRKFLKKIPALSKVIEAINAKMQKQEDAHIPLCLIGLDGRRLNVRSKHSALNTLLQSAGAVVMKKATVILWQDLEAAGYHWGTDVIQMAHVHDEYQLAARPEIAEEVGRLGVNAIRKAGEYFHFRCPLDGEYKVGHNWAECH